MISFSDNIYPIELEIRDTTEADMSVSYLELPLAFDSEGRLRTTFSDKRDDFNFPIVNLPFICSYIPAAPAHRVYDIAELVVPGGDRDLNLTERKPWFWNFLVESNHLSRKYIIMSYPLFKVRYQWNPDRLVTRLPRRVSPVEQELFALQGHLRLHPV
jgi:hypothetical protein